MLRARGGGSIVVAVLLTALQWTSLALSQSATFSANPSATSAATNCQDNVPGTNVSVCFFTVAGAPECARPCLIETGLTVPCATTDLRCLCSHSNELEQGALPCLKANCSITDLTTTVNYYFGICNNNHFPLEGASSSSVSSSPSASAATSSTPLTTSPISGAASASPQPQSSLSQGAKAGIGVGCAIAGLVALLALGFFLLRSRERSKRRRKSPAPGNLRQMSLHSQPPPAFSPQDAPYPTPGTPGRMELGEKSLPPTPRRLSFVKQKRPSMFKDSGDSWAGGGRGGGMTREPVEIEGAVPVEIDGMEAERRMGGPPPRY